MPSKDYINSSPSWTPTKSMETSPSQNLMSRRINSHTNATQNTPKYQREFETKETALKDTLIKESNVFQFERGPNGTHITIP